MQEKEFRKLMEKSLEGSLTEKETKLLNDFYEQMAERYRGDHFKNKAHRIHIKDSIWSGVTKNTKTGRPSLLWKRIALVGIVVLGFVGIAKNIWLAKSTSVSVMPSNEITLELEDGTVKILKDDGTSAIFDKKGKAIGDKKGNMLIYKKAIDGEREVVYNTLNVPFGKTFEILLSDGTKVNLNAGSSLKYPVHFLQGKERRVIVKGEAFLNVAKDSSAPFIVQTNEMDVRVLGTQFNVHAYPEDLRSEVVLIEGSVALYQENEAYDKSNVTQLEPGYKGSFNRANGQVSKEMVLTSIYTSWMSGELVFREMEFDLMLKKLERHYNVTIINNNRALAQEKFNASFGNVSLDRVLENLKTYHGIDYEINDEKIIIK